MRILQCSLGVQTDIRDALQKYGEVIYWNWSGQDRVFNQKIRELVDQHKPDLVWMQIQTPGILNEQTAQYIGSKAKVVNWTGDCRSPLPRWFLEVGRQIHLTLFTNMPDVEELRRYDVKTEYLQIGFPDKIFTPEGDKREEAEIVFFGNNVGGFPMSKFRQDMVDALAKRYGNRFKAYGINLGNGFGGEFNQHEEAKIYRGAKIGINCSHFNYSRYSSDRIFRLMGTGVMCLSHNYNDIDKEFEVGTHLDIWNTIEGLFDKI